MTDKKGPFGCKCQDLAHHVTGDGCDECNKELADEVAPINIQAPKLVSVPGCMTLVFEVTDKFRAVLGEWHDVGHPATDEEVIDWAMYVLQDDALTLQEDYNIHKLKEGHDADGREDS